MDDHAGMDGDVGGIVHARMPSGRFVQKRELILEAASRKFNAMGVRGATLEDIACEVGMNLTSIRHYYRRKDDLVGAAFQRAIAVHAERFELALGAGDREARVRKLVNVYFNLRRGMRDGSVPELMVFGDMRSLSQEQAATVWPRYVALFETVRRIMADPEEVEGDRLRVNARTYFLMSQLVRSVFWLPSYPVDSFAWVEEKFADILLNGLAAPGVTPVLARPPAPDQAAPTGSSWESFLLAATTLINAQGYRGASVDAIARKLNRTKGSFYHHVEGKGDLLVACFNRSLCVLRDAQREAVSREQLGINQAYAAVTELVRRQQTAAGPLLRASALLSVEPAARDRMLAEMAQVVTRFSGMVTDGIIDGSARPCDARVAGEMMMVTINSAAQIGGWSRGVNADNVIGLFARPMFHGLYG